MADEGGCLAAGCPDGAAEEQRGKVGSPRALALHPHGWQQGPDGKGDSTERLSPGHSPKGGKGLDG